MQIELYNSPVALLAIVLEPSHVITKLWIEAAYRAFSALSCESHAESESSVCQVDRACLMIYAILVVEGTMRFGKVLMEQLTDCIEKPMRFVK